MCPPLANLLRIHGGGGEAARVVRRLRRISAVLGYLIRRAAGKHWVAAFCEPQRLIHD